MRFAITGEHGFIGSNLARVIQEQNHDFVPLSLDRKGNPNFDVVSSILMNRVHLQPGKRPVPCVYRCGPDVWADIFRELKIDVVIHNAAVVGTDVVGLNPGEATLTNVLGTRNVVLGANQSRTAVSYMGTSVIYDASLYQDRPIKESDNRRPTTYYGQLKLASEDIVKNSGTLWNIIRPLFAYGGDGDMNSLVAKIFFAHLTGTEQVPIFLDPDMYKDYIFVDDYCRAVVRAATEGLWNDDYNIAAETPVVVGRFVKGMSTLVDRDLNEIIKWHPETDYLGNHRMTSDKFRNALRRRSVWAPELTLSNGLARVLKDMQGIVAAADSSSYNPLMHLEKAATEGVDLTRFFPT
jgi:nucleoside-diphosphate-sugar epimerase